MRGGDYMYAQIQDLLFDGSGALIPELLTNATSSFGSMLVIALPLVFGVAIFYWVIRHFRGTAKV